MDQTDLNLWISCALIGLTIVLPWFAEALNGRFDIFNIKNVFLLYILLQFSIWPIFIKVGEIVFLFGHEVMFVGDLYDSFIKGQYFVLTGLVFFYIGYYLIRHSGVVKRGESRFSQNPVLFLTWDNGRVFFVYWISLAVALLAFITMMSRYGGLVFYIQNIDLLRTTEAAGWGIFLYPLIASQIGVAVFTAHSFAKRRYEWFAVLGILVIVGFGFVIGIRTLVIAPLITTLILFHLIRRSVHFDWKFLVGAMIFVLLNIIYVSFRAVGTDFQEYSVGLTTQQLLLQFFGRFHGGDSMARIIDVVGRSDYQYGILSVWDLIISPIPRAVWSEKPLSLGVIANSLFWPDFFSVDDTGAAVPTLNGELYWILGLPAICLGMFAFGVIFRIIVRKLQIPDLRSMIAYSCWFAFAAFVNETLNLHLFQLIFKLLVLYSIILFIDVNRSQKNTVPFRSTCDEITGIGKS